MKKKLWIWHDAEIYVERMKVQPIMNECVAQQTDGAAREREKRKIRWEYCENFHESFPGLHENEAKNLSDAIRKRQRVKLRTKSGEIGGVRMSIPQSFMSGRQNFVVVIVKLNRIVRYMFRNNSPLPLCVQSSHHTRCSVVPHRHAPPSTPFQGRKMFTKNSK